MSLSESFIYKDALDRISKEFQRNILVDSSSPSLDNIKNIVNEALRLGKIASEDDEVQQAFIEFDIRALKNLVSNANKNLTKAISINAIEWTKATDAEIENARETLFKILELFVR